MRLNTKYKCESLKLHDWYKNMYLSMWRTGLASDTELDCDRLNERAGKFFLSLSNRGKDLACIKLHHKQYDYNMLYIIASIKFLGYCTEHIYNT